MSIETAIVVTAFTLCFQAAPSEGSCNAAVSDAQLAGAVTGAGWSQWPRSMLTLADTLGRDQMRQAGGMAGYATGLLLADLELEAMSRAAHKDDLLGASPLAMDQFIVNGPGGTATISTEIHTGEIRMDGVSLGRL
ncbi:MAG TPA: hypothetical protein VF440_05805 [Novosphingobium sp.]